jgi:hypothetical protein
LPNPCNGEAEVGDGVLRRQWRTDLLLVTRSLTACSSSDPTIRAAEHISATTGIVTPVLETPFSIQMNEMPAGLVRAALSFEKHGIEAPGPGFLYRLSLLAVVWPS